MNRSKLRIFSILFWQLQLRIRKCFFFLFCTKDLSTPFLSQASYKYLCDFIFVANSNRQVQPYEIIFLPSDSYQEFANFAETIANPYILVSAGSDHELTNSLFNLIDSKYLIHFFAQNTCIRSKKVTSIPIGLENLSLQSNGIVQWYLDVIDNTHQLRFKKPHILYGFNIRTNPNIRYDCLSNIEQHPLRHKVYALPPHYIKELAASMFVVSPEGNGLDCHRTWEALYLNAIPIVVGREFYDNYPDFPGLVLNSWSDLSMINSSNIVHLYHHHLKKLVNFRAHYFDYWQNKIRSFSHSF